MTPEVENYLRETRYMEVEAERQDESKEIFQRKIKLILVNHFPDRGIPYSYAIGDDKNAEDDDESTVGGAVERSKS